MLLGITSIQRNRGPWIAEWILFHYLVGFRKFYIFTHICTDNTEEVLKNLQKKIDIEIFPVKGHDSPQIKCYQHSCSNFLSEVDWMAFIDGDEFLFSPSNDSMDKALENYSDKKISALGVYWSIFGSSGHIEEPNGLIIENFKRRALKKFSDNRHIKSIIRGGQNGNTFPADPHFFKTPLGRFDEKLRPINSGLTNYSPTYQKFRINHYITQSYSYYLNFKKLPGASADNTEDYARPDGWWEECDRNEISDHSMDKYVSPLKKLLDSFKL